MGSWRYRKSIDVGGGFRINISKSGVGFSYGVRGFRQSIMPNGRIRNTFTIPGTGFSYVDEKNIGSSENNQEGTYTEFKISVSDIESGNAYTEFANICNIWLSKLNNIKSWKKTIAYVSIGFALFSLFVEIPLAVSLVLFLIGEGYQVYRYSCLQKEKINITYDLDEISFERNSIVRFVDILKSNLSLEHLYGMTEGLRARTNAGTSRSVSTKKIAISREAPKMIITNVECFRLPLMSAELYLLPDVILFIDNLSVFAVNYQDVKAVFNTYNIVLEQAPADAEIIGWRWKFSCNDGSRDHRFNDNCQLPVCCYGKLSLMLGDKNLLDILGSNKKAVNDSVQALNSLIKLMTDESNCYSKTKNDYKEHDESNNETANNLTEREKRAINKATLYVQENHCSYKGLLQQLEFLGFPRDEAIKAADYCDVNWKEQAINAAREILKKEELDLAELSSRLIKMEFEREEALSAAKYCIENKDY